MVILKRWRVASLFLAVSMIVGCASKLDDQVAQHPVPVPSAPVGAPGSENGSKGELTPGGEVATPTPTPPPGENTGGTTAPAATTTPKPTERPRFYLQGSFRSTDGTTVDLTQDSGKPTVMVFASDVCTTCDQEARAFRAYLKQPEKAPSRINLLTILMMPVTDEYPEQVALEDTQAWKQARDLPWVVGYEGDPQLKLIKKYCGDAGKVPCLIVHTPERGIVMQALGNVKIEDIVNLTGPWEEP